MIAAGYQLKRIIPPPGWLVTAPTHIRDVCSVSGCVNDNVVELGETFSDNPFGLANSSETLWSLATEGGADLEGAQLFYYTAFEKELESDGWVFEPAEWKPLSEDCSGDGISSPDGAALRLLGFDVVVLDFGLLHSPLSCNSVANENPVNEHCLFDGFEQAKDAIDSGKFGEGCEPGDYRIYAVNLVIADSGQPS